MMTLQNKVSSLQDQVFDLRTELISQKQNRESAVILSQKDISDNSSRNSITSVGVMPVLLRDGFFGKTVYQGTGMDISVSIKDGTGLILVNTEVPTEIDFQSSARDAVRSSEIYLGINLSTKDIIFSIYADGSKSLLMAIVQVQP